MLLSEVEQDAVRAGGEDVNGRIGIGDLQGVIGQVYLHNVGPNQTAFIDTFGSEVLPGFVRIGP